MAELDWHAERTDNSNLVTLDNLRVSDSDNLYALLKLSRWSLSVNELT